MDSREEERWDRWAKGIMDRAPLESPSPDFTQKLMQRMAVEERKEYFQYRPPLPKGVIVVLLIGFVGLLLLFFSQYEPDLQQGLSPRLGLSPGLDLSPIIEGFWAWMGRFAPSKIAVQAVLIFGLFCLVQFSVLKWQLEKRLPN